MLWSPMSEIPRFGRSRIYCNQPLSCCAPHFSVLKLWRSLSYSRFTITKHCSNCCSLDPLGFRLAALPTGYAVNMPMFLVFRFLTGVIGSPTLATGGATIMDMYDMGAASYAIASWEAFAIFSPCIGPILGGFVSPAEGWRWNIWIKYSLIPKFSDPTFKPEVVLPPVWFGSISLPICLFFYGRSASESVHWIVPIISTSFFAIGPVTLFQSCLNYLAISYPLYAAPLFAGNGLFRATFAAIFPLFASFRNPSSQCKHNANYDKARQLFRKVGVGPGNSLLGGISICFIPIPFLLYCVSNESFDFMILQANAA
jgi:MFS family permease